MSSLAWVDEHIVPLADARVPITDRGFLWGDHVFEVLRAAGRRVLDVDAHLERLARSAALVQMAAPPPARIRGAIDALVAAADLPAAALRVIWTRGDTSGGLAPRHAGRPRLIVTVEPLPPAPAGVRLAALHLPRVGGFIPAGAKSGNYLGSVLAVAAAEHVGADDALLVDIDGAVLETSSASLFVIDREGGIAAPSGPILPGVTAARVRALLGERGHPVVARRISLADVFQAAELFVTSARRGPVPVVALDRAARAVGPLTSLAMSVYTQWIERAV